MLSQRLKRKGSLMSETNIIGYKRTVASEPQTIEKKIGMTTYEVSLYFSKTSTESMSDKVMRLLENDLSVKNF